MPSAEATLAVVPSAAPNPTATPALSQADLPTQTVTAAVPPVATSRGPNLEASDPAMVKLDSGGLQLVEFFRFT